MANRKPLFIKIQAKLRKAVETLEFFTSTEWKFSNANIYSLIDEMSDVDIKLFNIDVRDIDWQVYIEHYCLGTKKFLLKEDMSKMEKCRRELAK
jgi:fatty acyl-CoA reductase